MSANAANDGYPQGWYNEGMKKFDDYQWVPCDMTADARHVGSTLDRPLFAPNIVGADLEALQLSLALGATETFRDALPVIRFH